jgi:hypothetical protein
VARRTFSDLPGWVFDVVEVSPGVHRVKATDEKGLSSELSGPNLDALVGDLRRWAGQHDQGVPTRRRDELKREFGGLYDMVITILAEEDPVRLDPKVSPDGYELEAHTILPRLRACSNTQEVKAVVHEEFTRWFDPDVAGGISRYQRVAKRIWAALGARLPRRKKT